MTDVCWCGGKVLQARSEKDRPVCLASKYHDPLATGRHTIKTVYIAGPMSGYPECNYPAFHSAEVQLRAQGYDVRNPANADDRVEYGHYTDFLREDLRMLLDCDAVALLPEWHRSVGARNEVQVAGTIGLEVHPLSHFLEGAEPEGLKLEHPLFPKAAPVDRGPYDRVAEERAARRRSSYIVKDSYGAVVRTIIA